ncbi:MAG: DUF1996 domain-containing protein [Pseudomonadota bacterium]
MLNSIIRTPALALTLPLFALIAASYPAHAEIYKWRDNRGVIQYSDRPPVESFTKVTRNEMVNALQTKELCAVGPIVKNNPISVASYQSASAFFSKFLTAGNTSTSPIKTSGLIKTAAGAGTLSKTSTTSPTANKLSTSTTSLLTTSSTIKTTSSNLSFLSGGKTVTVLGFSKKPVKTVATVTSPTTTTTTTTVPTTTTAPTTTTTTTAPTTTTVTQPVQVAVASPAPTTTTTSSTSANLIQVGLMPAVDISKNIIPAVGFSNLRIEPTTFPYGSGAGEFRIGCKVSHMSNDDPLVYPNQQGAAHHHTFFGNTSVNYKSDLMTLSSTGNSTCTGGIANRSAYWIPSIIDTSTNTAIVPDDTGFYYKAGNIDGTLIVAPPKGLRMIAGNSKATSESTSSGHNYSCLPGPNSTRQTWPWNKSFPAGANCEAGDLLIVQVPFPQCWDGKNLDSPNHQDHMAYPSHRTDQLPNFYCPATHPVAIPMITVNVKFNITKANQTATWRLASDNYDKSLPGGYSLHSDWVNGWDETVMAGIIKNCINQKRDAHSHLLCDGRTLY